MQSEHPLAGTEGVNDEPKLNYVNWADLRESNTVSVLMVAEMLFLRAIFFA